MNSLIALLGQDGISTAAIEALYLAQRDNPRLARDLVAAARELDPEYAWRPVWMLLKLARERGQIHPAVLCDLARVAEEITHWVGRLTLCQVFGHCACPAEAREVLYPVLEDCFSDRRVIIRAWALSALYSFRDDDRFRDDVQRMILVARRDPAPSMQARLRKLSAVRTRQRRHSSPLSNR